MPCHPSHTLTNTHTLQKHLSYGRKNESPQLWKKKKWIRVMCGSHFEIWETVFFNPQMRNHLRKHVVWKLWMFKCVDFQVQLISYHCLNIIIYLIHHCFSLAVQVVWSQWSLQCMWTVYPCQRDGDEGPG